MSNYRGFLMCTIFAPVHPVLSKQNAPRRQPYGHHLWGGAFKYFKLYGGGVHDALRVFVIIRSRVLESNTRQELK